MLLNFGKIRKIKENDPIFNLEIGKLKDYYEGIYYLDKEITILTNEVPTKIGPGMLEVFVTYDKSLTDSEYIDNLNNKLDKGKIPYYINYKMVNTNGSLLIWRYYIDILNNEVSINKHDYPTVVLTKNQIGNLIYTKEEMDELFLNRKEEHLTEETKWYITTPKLNMKKLNVSKDLFTINSGEELTSGEWITKDLNKFGITKLALETYDRSVYCDSSIKTYYDEEVHYSNSVGEVKWNDMFRRGNISWYHDKFGTEYPITYLHNHRIAFNTEVWMSAMQFNLGEYFSNFNPNRNLSEITMSYYFGNNLPDIYAFKIEHNTYIPGLNYKNNFRLGETYEESIRVTRLTGDPLVDRSYSHGIITSYLSRIYTTPDEDLVYYPVVHYGDGLANIISDTTKIKEKYTYHPQYQNQIEDINPRSRYEFKLGGLFIPSNFLDNTPKNKDLGLISSFTRRKTSLEEIGNLSREDVTYDSIMDRIGVRYNNDPNIVNNNLIPSHEKYVAYRTLLMEGDPYKFFFRSISINRFPLNHLDKLDYIINDSGYLSGIRLGEEVRTTFDLSDIPTSNRANRIKKLEYPDHMALTYLKIEINKDALKYQDVSNKESYYTPFVITDGDAMSKLENLINLGDNNTLSVDKITIGMSPIQIRRRGVWSNITR